MKKCVIELEDIVKSYGNVKAVNGISLQVYKGEVITGSEPSTKNKNDLGKASILCCFSF